MSSGTLLLKKYANRRLYDTEKSCYVTLNEVAEAIHSGRLVKIVDANSDEDVTAFILTQIVLEKAKTKNALLPVPVLHMIIRYGDNILAEFFEKYFQQTFQAFMNNRTAMDNNFQQWLEMGLNMTRVVQQNLTEMSPFQNIFDSFKKEKKREEDKE